MIPFKMINNMSMLYIIGSQMKGGGGGGWVAPLTTFSLLCIYGMTPKAFDMVKRAKSGLQKYKQ